MSTLVTKADVQHWGACQQVVLTAGTHLTESARQWLEEQHIHVEFEEEPLKKAVIQSTSLPSSSGEALLEMQLLQIVPQVLKHLDLTASDDAIRDALRVILRQETPHLPQVAPEQATLSRSDRAIVTVLGKDRTGIIAAITSLLTVRHANVLDINQTLFGDLFSMNMAVDISHIRGSFAELKEALEKAGSEMQLHVMVQREAVFDYMHRV